MNAPPHGQSDGQPARRRIIRELLYGRIVDHAAKTRGRIGITILVFALGYSVIAARLVMFATSPEGHGGRRAAVFEAVGTPRPDLLDPNGRILPARVGAPSLFRGP